VLGGYCGEMRAMITFAAWTGVRQGELFALQWDDVSEDEIIVRRSRKLDGSLGPPKNGQSRTIPLLPPARVLDQVPRREGSPFVFHSPQGKPLIKGTHGWSWQKVKAAARVEFRWHDLRHFCATQLLEMGLDHFAVSVQLARPHRRRRPRDGPLRTPQRRRREGPATSRVRVRAVQGW
ncbi:MAG: tyrosine-type recombinase/integrase, partial [Solirubrobacterales bacterium]